MPFSRIARIAAPVAALAVLVPLTGSVPTASASERHPTNAAKVFRWGNASVKDEFHGGLAKRWKVNKSGLVRNQHGMLTLDSTRRSGTRHRDADRQPATLRPLGGPRPRPAVRRTRYRLPRDLGAGPEQGQRTAGPRDRAQRLRAERTPFADARTQPAEPRLHRVQADGPPRQPVPHLRRRGDPHAHLVVRRHQGDPHRAPFAARTGAAYNIRFRLQARPAPRCARVGCRWTGSATTASSARTRSRSSAPQLRHTSYAHAC